MIFMDCTSPIHINGDTFPCGKCYNCRAKSRQEWVFRLRMEYNASDFGLFVTLTYDDDHLPPDGVSRRDVQLFLKRLRKHYKSQTLRYFIVSEYGDDRNTARPHYHALLFFKDIKRNTELYDNIESSWQNGIVQFGEIEEGSIVYCTKYCLKGSDVPRGKNDNFRLLSKFNGGIGADYIDRNFEFHKGKIDQPQIVSQGEYTSPMPRYFRNRIFRALDLDQYERAEITTMYMDHVREYRAKNDKKQRQIFDRLHPGSSYHDYKIWRNQKEDLKEQFLLKRTKKQTKL